MSDIDPHSSRRTVLRGAFGAVTAAAMGSSLNLTAANAAAPARGAHDLLHEFLSPPRSWAPRVWCTGWPRTSRRTESSKTWTG